MNQSTIILGSIIVLFFVYITVKGELPTYAGLLLLAPGGTAAPVGTAAASAQAASTSSSIISGTIGSLAGL